MHCQDCRSDVSGSELVEFSEKQGCGGLEHKTFKGNSGHLSRRNSRAPLACHGWSRIFFKIAEEI